MICKSCIKELLEKRFFRVGDKTYVLDEREFPHDERCEGSMCFCASRARLRMIK